MAKLPMKPRTGQKTIAALYRSICEVIDYLPTLTVRGDGKTVKITNSDNGKVISVKSDENKYWDYKGNYQNYIFGNGVKAEYDEEMISGMQGASKEDLPQYVTLNVSGDNQYISAVYPSAYNGTINDPVIIKYIGPVPSGGGGSGGVIYTPGSGISISGNVIKTTFQPGCDIWFWDHNNDTNPEDRITVQNGLSAGYGIRFRDNTSEPGVTTYHQHLMDVNIAGGQWLEYNVSAATMSCKLTGDGSTVFINSNGVISAKTGTILPTPVANTVLSSNSSKQLVWAENTGGTPSPTPSGGGMAWPNYFNLGEESDSRVYPLMRYTATSGGWLRISLKSGTNRCVGVWIGDNYYGLGGYSINPVYMTFSLPVPPGSSFYVDVDWNINSPIWFDSSLNLSKATNAEMEYWLTPPYWEQDRKTITSCRYLFEDARNRETYCYNYLTGAQNNLKQMITDWTTYERYVPDPEDEYEQHPDGYTPQELSFYEENLNEITGCYEYCEQPLTAAMHYCSQLDTLNQSLPSACPMYDYQATDIPAKCQQYYDTIGQYVISAQHYYDLASAYWAEHE